MSTPHDPHGGADRSDALAHTFPPLPREGEPSDAPDEPPAVSLADLPAFLEHQRRSITRDALWGRALVILAILALLVANTLAQRSHTRELLQSIDWDRQHQSGLEDEVEKSLTRIENQLLAIEQRLPPVPEAVGTPQADPTALAGVQKTEPEAAGIGDPGRTPLAAATEP